VVRETGAAAMVKLEGSGPGGKKAGAKKKGKKMLVKSVIAYIRSGKGGKGKTGK